MLDAGIGQHRRIGQDLLDRFQLGQGGRLAGDDAGNEDGVGDRGKDRAARPVGQAALVERPGEFRGDVIEQREVAAAQPVAVAHRRAGIRIPWPHVGSVGAGQDLAHEAGAGRGGERDGAHRVPQHVDAERHGDLALHLPDGVGHGRGRRGIDLELIGPVILVAEHDGIDAGRLQCPQILTDAFDQPIQAGLGIIERRSRQGAEMHHGNDGFLAGENPRESRCHVGWKSLPLRVGSVRKVIPDGLQGSARMLKGAAAGRFVKLTERPESPASATT